ncbi:hypothetical protein NEMIN01_0216 [Nematocida minor]|uniref:uncharacterized protein n=1 Tax=Nematocida minor TaxID=1912983 RepID=UPI00221FAC59|nr:uncharacterized protein NEMIN01_0112 [Nematocida minor]XP_051332118.1 uncharacterized protein NEMIN01_0216 [Nematocida minor]KAI5188848.1 hypothetical protein NEMIN01_0112 [Nematocida minor]KAI5188952.1 hypothetical protein NEMIN01_0216 [Nematocida minor]
MREDHSEGRKTHYKLREEGKSEKNMLSSEAKRRRVSEEREMPEKESSSLHRSREYERKEKSSREEEYDSLDKILTDGDTEESGESEALDEERESSSKDDFFYSDDKLGIDSAKSGSAAGAGPMYTNGETNEQDTDSADNITESRETHIYYNKEESNSSEGEDIIEYRETTLPVRSAEHSRKRDAAEEDAKKARKMANQEIGEMHQMEKQQFVEDMKEQEKRVEMRERGWKANSRPLIWKYEIEGHEDETEPINEEAVIEKFRNNIEKTYIKHPKKYSTEQYYNKTHSKKKKNLNETELKRIKDRIETNRLLEVQANLRRRTKEEQGMLNKTRNLHVKLKEIGHQTEASEIFALLTQEYIFQKKDIVHFMGDSLNNLSSIHNKVAESTDYFLRCLEFIEQKITIE